MNALVPLGTTVPSTTGGHGALPYTVLRRWLHPGFDGHVDDGWEVAGEGVGDGLGEGVGRFDADTGDAVGLGEIDIIRVDEIDGQVAAVAHLDLVLFDRGVAGVVED